MHKDVGQLVRSTVSALITKFAAFSSTAALSTDVQVLDEKNPDHRIICAPDRMILKYSHNNSDCSKKIAAAFFVYYAYFHLFKQSRHCPIKIALKMFRPCRRDTNEEVACSIGEMNELRCWVTHVLYPISLSVRLVLRNCG